MAMPHQTPTQVFQGLGDIIIIGPLPLYEKGSYDFTTVSMSVGKHVLSKMARRIFPKLVMRLGCLKGKKLTELDFWEKF